MSGLAPLPQRVESQAAARAGHVLSLTSKLLCSQVAGCVGIRKEKGDAGNQSSDVGMAITRPPTYGPNAPKSACRRRAVWR